MKRLFLSVLPFLALPAFATSNPNAEAMKEFIRTNKATIEKMIDGDLDLTDGIPSAATWVNKAKIDADQTRCLGSEITGALPVGVCQVFGSNSEYSIFVYGVTISRPKLSSSSDELIISIKLIEKSDT